MLYGESGERRLTFSDREKETVDNLLHLCMRACIYSYICVCCAGSQTEMQLDSVRSDGLDFFIVV